MNRYVREYTMKKSERPLIDKSGLLELKLNGCGALFVEGDAALGKSEAVRALIARHPEAAVYQVDLKFVTNELDSRAIHEEILSAESRPERPVWFVFENMDRNTPECVISNIAMLAEDGEEDIKVIVISRDEPPSSLMKLLWYEQMDVITAEDFILDLEEISSLIEQNDSRLQAGELLAATGGWPGLVNLMIRLAASLPWIDSELCAAFPGV